MTMDFMRKCMKLEKKALKLEEIKFVYMPKGFQEIAVSTQQQISKLLFIFKREEDKLRSIIEKNATKKFDISKLRMIGTTKIRKANETNEAIVVFLVLSYPEMKIQHQDYEKITITDKKIFGFRTFQNAPPMLKLIKKLENSPFYPQLLILQCSGIYSKGMGIGIAQYLGASLNLPAFSIKNSFDDQFKDDGIIYPELEQKAMETLKEGGEYFNIIGTSGKQYGIVYKSTNKKEDIPLIVASANIIDYESIIAILKRICKYKDVMPEPVKFFQQNCYI